MKNQLPLGSRSLRSDAAHDKGDTRTESKETALTPHLRWHRGAAALCAAMVMSTGAGGAQPAAGKFPSRPLTLVVPYPAGVPMTMPPGCWPEAERCVGSAGRGGQPVWRQRYAGRRACRQGRAGRIHAALCILVLPDGIGAPGAPCVRSTEGFRAGGACQPCSVRDHGRQTRIGKNASGSDCASRDPSGKLSYGSSGIGSINHFATEAFAESAGIRLTHVPYRGMTPAMQDTAGGHVDIVLGSVPSTMAQVKSGRVRALA